MPYLDESALAARLSLQIDVFTKKAVSEAMEDCFSCGRPPAPANLFDLAELASWAQQRLARYDTTEYRNAVGLGMGVGCCAVCWSQLDYTVAIPDFLLQPLVNRLVERQDTRLHSHLERHWVVMMCRECRESHRDGRATITDLLRRFQSVQAQKGFADAHSPALQDELAALERHLTAVVAQIG